MEKRRSPARNTTQCIVESSKAATPKLDNRGLYRRSKPPWKWQRTGSTLIAIIVISVSSNSPMLTGLWLSASIYSVHTE